MNLQFSNNELVDYLHNLSEECRQGFFVKILDGPYSTEKLRKLTVRPTVSLIDIGQYLDNDSCTTMKLFDGKATVTAQNDKKSSIKNQTKSVRTLIPCNLFEDLDYQYEKSLKKCRTPKCSPKETDVKNDKDDKENTQKTSSIKMKDNFSIPKCNITCDITSTTVSTKKQTISTLGDIPELKERKPQKIERRRKSFHDGVRQSKTKKIEERRYSTSSNKFDRMVPNILEHSSFYPEIELSYSPVYEEPPEASTFEATKNSQHCISEEHSKRLQILKRRLSSYEDGRNSSSDCVNQCKPQKIIGRRQTYHNEVSDFFPIAAKKPRSNLFSKPEFSFSEPNDDEIMSALATTENALKKEEESPYMTLGDFIKLFKDKAESNVINKNISVVKKEVIVISSDDESDLEKGDDEELHLYISTDEDNVETQTDEQNDRAKLIAVEAIKNETIAGKKVVTNFSEQNNNITPATEVKELRKKEGCIIEKRQPVEVQDSKEKLCSNKKSTEPIDSKKKSNNKNPIHQNSFALTRTPESDHSSVKSSSNEKKKEELHEKLYTPKHSVKLSDNSSKKSHNSSRRSSHHHDSVAKKKSARYEKLSPTQKLIEKICSNLENPDSKTSDQKEKSPCSKKSTDKSKHKLPSSHFKSAEQARKEKKKEESLKHEKSKNDTNKYAKEDKASKRRDKDHKKSPSFEAKSMKLNVSKKPEYQCLNAKNNCSQESTASTIKKISKTAEVDIATKKSHNSDVEYSQKDFDGKRKEQNSTSKTLKENQKQSSVKGTVKSFETDTIEKKSTSSPNKSAHTDFKAEQKETCFDRNTPESQILNDKNKCAREKNSATSKTSTKSLTRIVAKEKLASKISETIKKPSTPKKSINTFEIRYPANKLIHLSANSTEKHLKEEEIEADFGSKTSECQNTSAQEITTSIPKKFTDTLEVDKVIKKSSNSDDLKSSQKDFNKDIKQKKSASKTVDVKEKFPIYKQLLKTFERSKVVNKSSVHQDCKEDPKELDVAAQSTMKTLEINKTVKSLPTSPPKVAAANQKQKETYSISDHKPVPPNVQILTKTLKTSETTNKSLKYFAELVQEDLRKEQKEDCPIFNHKCTLEKTAATPEISTKTVVKNSPKNSNDKSFAQDSVLNTSKKKSQKCTPTSPTNKDLIDKRTKFRMPKKPSSIYSKSKTTWEPKCEDEDRRRRIVNYIDDTVYQDMFPKLKLEISLVIDPKIEENKRRRRQSIEAHLQMVELKEAKKSAVDLESKDKSSKTDSAKEIPDKKSSSASTKHNIPRKRSPAPKDASEEIESKRFKSAASNVSNKHKEESSKVSESNASSQKTESSKLISPSKVTAEKNMPLSLPESLLTSDKSSLNKSIHSSPSTNKKTNLIENGITISPEEGVKEISVPTALTVDNIDLIFPSVTYNDNNTHSNNNITLHSVDKVLDRTLRISTDSAIDLEDDLMLLERPNPKKLAPIKPIKNIMKCNTEVAVDRLASYFVSLFYIYLKYFESTKKENFILSENVNYYDRYRVYHMYNLYERVKAIDVKYFRNKMFFKNMMITLKALGGRIVKLNDRTVIKFIEHVIFLLRENFTSPSDTRTLFNILQRPKTIMYMAQLIRGLKTNYVNRKLVECMLDFPQALNLELIEIAGTVKDVSANGENRSFVKARTINYDQLPSPSSFPPKYARLSNKSSTKENTTEQTTTHHYIPKKRPIEINVPSSSTAINPSQMNSSDAKSNKPLSSYPPKKRPIPAVSPSPNIVNQNINPEPESRNINTEPESRNINPEPESRNINPEPESRNINPESESPTDFLSTINQTKSYLNYYQPMNEPKCQHAVERTSATSYNIILLAPSNVETPVKTATLENKSATITENFSNLAQYNNTSNNVVPEYSNSTNVIIHTNQVQETMTHTVESSQKRTVIHRIDLSQTTNPANANLGPGVNNANLHNAYLNSGPDEHKQPKPVESQMLLNNNSLLNRLLETNITGSFPSKISEKDSLSQVSANIKLLSYNFREKDVPSDHGTVQTQLSTNANQILHTHPISQINAEKSIQETAISQEKILSSDAYNKTVDHLAKMMKSCFSQDELQEVKKMTYNLQQNLDKSLLRQKLENFHKVSLPVVENIFLLAEQQRLAQEITGDMPKNKSTSNQCDSAVFQNQFIETIPQNILGSQPQKLKLDQNSQSMHKALGQISYSPRQESTLDENPQSSCKGLPLTQTSIAVSQPNSKVSQSVAEHASQPRQNSTLEQQFQSGHKPLPFTQTPVVSQYQNNFLISDQRQQLSGNIQEYQSPQLKKSLQSSNFTKLSEYMPLSKSNKDLPLEHLKDVTRILYELRQQQVRDRCLMNMKSTDISSSYTDTSPASLSQSRKIGRREHELNSESKQNTYDPLVWDRAIQANNSSLPKPQTKPHPNPQQNVQPNRQPNTESHPQRNSQPNAQPNPQLNIQPNCQPNPQLNFQPSIQSNSQSNPQLNRQINPQPDLELNLQPNCQANPQLNFQPNIQSNPQRNLQPHRQSNPHLNLQSNPQPNLQPNFPPNIQTNFRPNSQAKHQPKSQLKPQFSVSISQPAQKEKRSVNDTQNQQAQIEFNTYQKQRVRTIQTSENSNKIQSPLSISGLSKPIQNNSPVEQQKFQRELPQSQQVPTIMDILMTPAESNSVYNKVSPWNFYSATSSMSSVPQVSTNIAALPAAMQFGSTSSQIQQLQGEPPLQTVVTTATAAPLCVSSTTSTLTTTSNSVPFVSCVPSNTKHVPSQIKATSTYHPPTSKTIPTSDSLRTTKKNKKASSRPTKAVAPKPQSQPQQQQSLQNNGPNHNPPNQFYYSPNYAYGPYGYYYLPNNPNYPMNTQAHTYEQHNHQQLMLYQQMQTQQQSFHSLGSSAYYALSNNNNNAAPNYPPSYPGTSYTNHAVSGYSPLQVSSPNKTANIPNFTQNVNNISAESSEVVLPQAQRPLTNNHNAQASQVPATILGNKPNVSVNRQIPQISAHTLPQYTVIETTERISHTHIINQNRIVQPNIRMPGSGQSTQEQLNIVNLDQNNEVKQRTTNQHNRLVLQSRPGNNENQQVLRDRQQTIDQPNRLEFQSISNLENHQNQQKQPNIVLRDQNSSDLERQHNQMAIQSRHANYNYEQLRQEQSNIILRGQNNQMDQITLQLQRINHEIQKIHTEKQQTMNQHDQLSLQGGIPNANHQVRRQSINQSDGLSLQGGIPNSNHQVRRQSINQSDGFVSSGRSPNLENQQNQSNILLHNDNQTTLQSTTNNFRPPRSSPCRSIIDNQVTIAQTSNPVLNVPLNYRTRINYQKKYQRALLQTKYQNYSQSKQIAMDNSIPKTCNQNELIPHTSIEQPVCNISVSNSSTVSAPNDMENQNMPVELLDNNNCYGQPIRELEELMKTRGEITPEVQELNLPEFISINDLPSTMLTTNSSVSPSNNKVCETCGAPAPSQCSACEKVAYCSEACQLEDWDTHQLKCTMPNETNNDA